MREFSISRTCIEQAIQELQNILEDPRMLNLISREISLSITKLEEAEYWLTRAETTPLSSSE